MPAGWRSRSNHVRCHPEPSLRRAAGAGGFPDPRPQRPRQEGKARQAAGLSGQRGVRPEAASGHPGHDPLPGGGLFQHPPRRSFPVADRDRPVRGGAHQGRTLPERAQRPLHRLHPQFDRSDQPRGRQLWPDLPERRRRGHPVDHGASREHRSVAAAPGREEDRHQGGALRRGRRPRHGRLPESVVRPHEAGGDHPLLQRSRHRHPGQDHRQAGA